MDVLLKDLSNDLTDVVNVLVATNTATAEQTKSMIGLVLNQLYVSLDSIKGNVVVETKEAIQTAPEQKKNIKIIRGRKVNDLSGKRFGRLVVEKIDSRKDGYIFYKCICDCGNTIVTRGASLKAGKTKSCGCLKREYFEKQYT